VVLNGQDFERLRWRCVRRGLLELDLMLGKFLDERYSSLSDAQAKAFAELANLEDPELWDLVTGRTVCTNPVHAEVLAMLSKS
jgi:antitoxin CptB